MPAEAGRRWEEWSTDGVGNDDMGRSGQGPPQFPLPPPPLATPSWAIFAGVMSDVLWLFVIVGAFILICHLLHGFLKFLEDQLRRDGARDGQNRKVYFEPVFRSDSGIPHGAALAFTYPRDDRDVSVRFRPPEDGIAQFDFVNRDENRIITYHAQYKPYPRIYEVATQTAGQDPALNSSHRDDHDRPPPPPPSPPGGGGGGGGGGNCDSSHFIHFPRGSCYGMSPTRSNTTNGMFFDARRPTSGSRAGFYTQQQQQNMGMGSYSPLGNNFAVPTSSGSGYYQKPRPQQQQSDLSYQSYAMRNMKLKDDMESRYRTTNQEGGRMRGIFHTLQNLQNLQNLNPRTKSTDQMRMPQQQQRSGSGQFGADGTRYRYTSKVYGADY